MKKLYDGDDLTQKEHLYNYSTSNVVLLFLFDLVD